MDCLKCKRESSEALCDSCFTKVIEKRARKEIRTKGLIRKGDELTIIDDGSPEAKINLLLMEDLSKELPIKIRGKQEYVPGQDTGGCKIILPWNADMEDELFLASVMENRAIMHLGHFTNSKVMHVKPLLGVTSEETARYARIKGLHPRTRKPSPIGKMLDMLEKEYPGTKLSMLKSSEEFRKAL